MRKAMKLAPCMLVVVALWMTSGCAIHTDTLSSISESGPSLNSLDLSGKKVWIRTFEHSAVSGVSTAYATSSNGNTASGIAVSRTTRRDAPDFVLHAIQDAEIFGVVTPVAALGKKPDLILEGKINTSWQTPWWSWVQLADLWVHTWFVPTLGRNHVINGEVHLYDAEYQRLHTWKFHYEKKYSGLIWWAWTHGGAYDTGSEAEIQPEAVQWVFNKIKESTVTASRPAIEAHASR